VYIHCSLHLPQLPSVHNPESHLLHRPTIDRSIEIVLQIRSTKLAMHTTTLDAKESIFQTNYVEHPTMIHPPSDLFP
jgi:hypothetical protein